MSLYGEKRAVALLSSGLDSTVALRLAQKDGWRITLALTLDYGQRAALSECTHSAMIARWADVPHRVLCLPWFSELGGSALLGEGVLPRPRLDDLSRDEFTRASADAVWVPNRNGVFLEVAAAFAESLGAEAVVVGFNREEAATFPDNSIAYLDAMNRALRFSTRERVSVMAPTAEWDKARILEAALSEGLPLSMLWSCYERGERMCGSCESCMRLKRALRARSLSLEDLFANPVL